MTTDNCEHETSLLLDNAREALASYLTMTQEQINEIVRQMALAGLSKQLELAQAAVKETGMGLVEDKVIKNIFATDYIAHSIKYEKTVGIIERNEYENYYEIAEPIGVIAGVTPSTNPTSTAMFKAIIAVKTRNPIVFAFHPSAQECSAYAARTLYEAALAAGAPAHCIQWIEEPSLEKTHTLMNHPQVALILATGGSGLVQAAYSCGKPALGVGPGNVPCYIEKTASLATAVQDLVISKTFDNGLICASEQALIVDRAVAEEVKNRLTALHCHFLNNDEVKQLESTAFPNGGKWVNPKIVGQSAGTVALMAGINVPAETKILLAPLSAVGEQAPLSAEKLSPILAYYEVEHWQEGVALAEHLVSYGGLGHSAVIHSQDEQAIRHFTERLQTGRLIVNSPSTHGAIGDLYNANVPSLTLGCGSFGQNSTTANVSAVNLINRKRVAYRTVNMQWFKIPSKIYFEYGSTRYLEKMPSISRAFIVTDKVMVSQGYTDQILYYLRKRQEYVHCQVFSDVESDPSLDTVQKGLHLLNSYQPDVIIAFGGGSVIDAAKGMWMFYEHPDIDFNSLTLKFLDIRKRTYKIPISKAKAQFVAIPTTSGTGSEVTSFTVITDKEKQIKYPLADYELTPDVAILDPQYTLSVPPAVTADTGLDVLTHALEAYVSVMASDYTDALALKAAQLVFTYLPRAYANGSDKEAREKMHNASCLAGMAFTNAFLGVNHALAHKLGGEFGLPHGRANALLLPHVIAYNSQVPRKITIFPKYSSYNAGEKYADIAHALGLPAGSTEEGVSSLITAVKDLIRSLGAPLSLSEAGVSREAFEAALPKLVLQAFEDQTTTTNPRMPLLEELESLYNISF